jgi:hypothetical protein
MPQEPRLNTKPRTLHNVEPTQDISAPWAQRIEEAINDLTKNQTLMMNKITNLERAQQQATKPPFRGQPQRSSQAWKPRAPNEQRVPNTLDPSNVISQEETPWCLPCGDSHWEHEFPRSNGEPDHMNVFDTINSIFSYLPKSASISHQNNLRREREKHPGGIGWRS